MKFGITIKPDHFCGAHCFSDAPGGTGGLRIRLDLRFPRTVERTLSIARLDGECHAQYEAWAVRDQSRGARSDGYGQPVSLPST